MYTIIYVNNNYYSTPNSNGKKIYYFLFASYPSVIIVIIQYHCRKKVSLPLCLLVSSRRHRWPSPCESYANDIVMPSTRCVCVCVYVLPPYRVGI